MAVVVYGFLPAFVQSVEFEQRYLLKVFFALLSLWLNKENNTLRNYWYLNSKDHTNAEEKNRPKTAAVFVAECRHSIVTEYFGGLQLFLIKLFVINIIVIDIKILMNYLPSNIYARAQTPRNRYVCLQYIYVYHVFYLFLYLSVHITNTYNNDANSRANVITIYKI